MSEFVLTVDVPLGPFEGAPITVYAAKGKSARLHSGETCSSLRTDNVLALTVPLDSVAIGRMCRQCAEWGTWARPDTALGIFLASLTGLGLLYELNSHGAGEADEEWTEQEVEETAALLSLGEWPSEDDEDDERFAVFEAARSLRDSIFAQWSRAAESLHRALHGVTMYPWLEDWARERLESKAEHVEMLRKQAAQLVRTEALVVVSAVSQSPEPDFPADDPAFCVLGDVARVKSLLQRLWRRWQNAVSDGWVGPGEHAFLAYDLTEALGNRRKGRDDLLARAKALISAWVNEAEARVDNDENQPGELVLVNVPSDDGERERPADFRDELSQWELGVIASYTVKADWGGRAMLLRVPRVIATRLLEGRSGLSCSPCADSDIERTRASLTTREPAEPLLPGVLDDTPVSERRPVTVAHLRTLRATRGFVDQPYVVFSAESGVEILSLTVIENRCADGWRGVLIAGASDLPASLMDPWRQKINACSDLAADQAEAGRRQVSDHPGFGHRLGVAAGEEVLASLLSSPRTGDAERDRALRCLAMVRSVDDLRDLDDGRDRTSSAIPRKVWYAVLAAEHVDLAPFRPEDAIERWERGIGVPLGVLADVQVYTTNADPAVAGKGHSPYCGHIRDRAITSDYDRIALADLLARDDFDWCGKCGGYAVRRFTDVQLDYYRSAHRLYEIHQRLHGNQSWSEHRLPDVSTITSELEDLRRWQPGAAKSYWRRGAAWRWRDLVTDLQRRAKQLSDAYRDEQPTGEVIRLR
ncbi:hypothetical protein GCM10029978_049300 [Actinoallomurus acanthiterrae]